MEINAFMVLVCSTFGVLVFISPLVAVLNFRSAISMALDFWTAAGLIRLSGVPSWSVLATVAMLIAIRKLSNFSLSHFRPLKLNGNI